MKIKYKIELLSDWHIGSGLDSGAEADSIVLKDDANLPYVPGKTIKGLFKDSLLEISELPHQTELENQIYHLFGKPAKSAKNSNGDAVSSQPGTLFFSNAELSSADQKDISAHELSAHLYKNVSSTRINEKGIAQKNSLRTMQVCIPVVLFGEIEGDDVPKTVISMACKWTRYIGVGRNRGLGRCKFSIVKSE